MSAKLPVGAETSDDPLLLIPCVEACGSAIVARIPFTVVELERVLAAKGWFASAMTLSGEPFVIGVLCPDCAKRVYPADVLAEMKRRRDSRTS